MMSSAEDSRFSDGLDDGLQPAQGRVEPGAESTSLQLVHPLDQLLDKEATTSTSPISAANSKERVNPAMDLDPLGENDVDPALHTLAVEHNAFLQYDENGRMKPIYTHPRGSLFLDHPSKVLWRERTIVEREITANLDHARSGDLSIHLYNIFRLKQRARSQITDINNFAETKKPPDRWTAWPMPPNVVPREHEVEKREAEEWKVGPYIKRKRRLGDELRELLSAQTTRTAKERFQMRHFECSSVETMEAEDQKPVVIADDVRAIKMLQPSIEHVMGNLDDLLMGLHFARNSYLSLKSSERGQRTSESRSPSTQGRANAGKQSKSSTDWGGNLGECLDESLDSEVETSKPKNPRPQKKQKRDATASLAESGDSFETRKGRLGLRDWSDVLGVASMIGIGSESIDRTASRCAKLFGEDLSFRGDSNVAGQGFHGRADSFWKDVEGSRSQSENDSDMFDGVHIDGFMRPIGREPLV